MSAPAVESTAKSTADTTSTTDTTAGTTNGTANGTAADTTTTSTPDATAKSTATTAEKEITTEELLKNPPHEEMLQEASAATDLLVALVSSPDHKNASEEKPEPAILKRLISFMFETMAVYWTPLLPRRASVELMARLQDDPDAFLEEGHASMDELAEKGNYVDTWPPFDPDLYRDALGRNILALVIVTDESKQSMLGLSQGTVYKWSDAVKEEVQRQLSQKDQ